MDFMPVPEKSMERARRVMFRRPMLEMLAWRLVRRVWDCLDSQDW